MRDKRPTPSSSSRKPARGRPPARDDNGRSGAGRTAGHTAGRSERGPRDGDRVEPRHHRDASRRKPREHAGDDHGGESQLRRGRDGTMSTSGAARPAGIKNPYVRFHQLKKPEIELQRSTLWDYPSQHYGKTVQGDPNYRGATPSYVIWNVVSRYTDAGAVVVDPFCGSGTTLDVCRDLGRKGRGFDLARVRAEVEFADARKLPLKKHSADLVFFDPPYADNLDYSEDPRCIGKLPAQKDDGENPWGHAMHDVIQEARRVLKPGGHLAMFVCDQYVAKKSVRAFHPLGLQLATLAEDAGFEMVDHVAVVRHGKALDDDNSIGARHATRAQFMLRGFSHLMIFTAK